jgi:peptidoglycan/LPS O-acetylase OafA/YrhL
LAENKRTGKINISKFYVRRMFRLMPPLFVSLAITYGLTYAGLLSGGITITGLAAQLLYFANYYGLFFDPGNTIPDGTGILWSLAVEEHFYIFYPLFMTLLLGSAIRPRTIGTLLGIGCLVVLAWRIHLVQSPDFVFYWTYYAWDTRIDSIIYGCILAVVINPVPELHRAYAISVGQWAVLATAVSTLMLTLLYRDTAFRETIRYSFQGLALIPLFYCMRVLINRIFPRTMMISISAETARECYWNDGRRTSAIPKIDFPPRILPSPTLGKRWGLDAAKRSGIEKRRRSPAPAAR